MKTDTRGLGLLLGRTYGMETEYGYDCPELFDQDINKMLGLPYANEKRLYVKNGGCLYDDDGHPEYATPECSHPWEVALYHHAGDILLNRKRQDLTEEDGCKRALRRDNIDWHEISSKRNLYGCHENYLIPNSLTPEVLRNNLTPYLVSGILLFGSGSVNQNDSFYLTTRVRDINYLETLYPYGGSYNSRVGNRAILSLSNEPLLPLEDSEYYRRLHITFRDTNVSHRATFLKIALTSIVLAMIEEGVQFTDIKPVKPVLAVKIFNKDLLLSRRVEVGVLKKEMSALEIQRVIYSRALAFLSESQGKTPLPPWVSQACKYWGEALRDLSECKISDQPNSAHWIDWWVKWHLIQRYRKDYPDSSPIEHFVVSQLYHDINPRTNLTSGLYREKRLIREFSAARLRLAANTPSSHVRAQMRSQYVQRQNQGKNVIGIDWLGCTENDVYIEFPFFK